MIMKFGFTNKCSGCNAINRGVASQNHSEACRNRIEEELRKGGHEGLRNAEDRITEQLAQRVQGDDDKKRKLERDDQEQKVKTSRVEQSSSSSSSAGAAKQLRQEEQVVEGERKAKASKISDE